MRPPGRNSRVSGSRAGNKKITRLPAQFLKRVRSLQAARGHLGTGEVILWVGITSILIVNTVLAILFACSLVWMTILALMWGIDLEYSRVVVWEALEPYVWIVIFCLVFLNYLFQIWFLHRAVNKVLLYSLVLVGGGLIPLSISGLHYRNYVASPGEYAITDELRPYFISAGTDIIRATERDIQTYHDLRASLEQITASSSSLPRQLQFLDGEPSRETCSRLALGRNTGVICVRSFSEMVGRGIVSHVLEVRLDPSGRASETSFDITELVETSRFFCRIDRVFGSRQVSLAVGIDRDRFVRCLGVAIDATSARIAESELVISRVAVHPFLPYSAIFLDSLSELVGSGYSVLEPVSPVAGAISVAGSTVSLAYFLLFASFILEAAARQRSVPSKRHKVRPGKGVDPPRRAVRRINKADG